MCKLKATFQDRLEGEKEMEVEIVEWLNPVQIRHQVLSQIVHRFSELRSMKGTVVFHKVSNFECGGVVYFGPTNLRVFLQGENK